MQLTLIEVMQSRAGTIYRALTGSDIPEATAHATGEGPLDEVTRRIVELETLARTVPLVADRMPRFSFTPKLDATQNDDQAIVELAVPGVDREDITVGVFDGRLVVSGFRRERSHREGLMCSHAEIPRGPFYREFRAAWPVQPEPDVALDYGVLRVHLKKAPAPSSTEKSS